MDVGMESSGRAHEERALASDHTPRARLWVSACTEGGPSEIPAVTNQTSLEPRLADVVSARLTLSRLLNVSSSSPWVCFGGSYAGSLAAWARLKVPGLLGGWGVGGLVSGSLSRVIGTPSPHTLLPKSFPQLSLQGSGIQREGLA